MEGRPLDEQELISRSKNGDVQAFAELVRIYQATALRVAYLVTRDASEAEDVTQESLVRAYGALGRFRTGSPFRPWLLRIVRNQALNRVRSSKRRHQLSRRVASLPVSGDAAPSPEAQAIGADEARQLLQALHELPDRYRVVIEHRYLLDLTERETSKILGIPLGTVKSRNTRGLAKLRDLIESRMSV